MRARTCLPVLLPFSVGLLATQVHSSLALPSETWGQVLASLHYIPIVVAAIVLGARAALFVALAAGVAHTLIFAVRHADPWTEATAQTLLFVCVGLTAARLALWRADKYRALQRPEHSSATQSGDLSTGSEVWLRDIMVGLVRQFRTPLTSIEGAGWVLVDPKLPDSKRRELVGILRKETHRLNRVLMDVLDFTQPRSPRFRMINVSKLVDDVLQLAGTAEQGQRFAVRKNIPSDLPALRGDPEQIKQVLLNLVMNSTQALSAGGQINVSARVEDDTFIITVNDDGIGIPASALDRIFEPFFSTHEQRLGLGLPVAQRIVTQHGGRITVASVEKKGTCITVILPVARSGG